MFEIGGLEFDYLQLCLIGGAFLIAGIVKGSIGFGLPVTAISLLTFVIPVDFALALLAIPIFASNLWQATATGQFVTVVKRFWPVIATLGLGIWLGAQIAAAINAGTLFLVLGLMLMLFVWAEVFRPHFVIPKEKETRVGVTIGIVGGVLGGVSATHGLPLVMYLSALKIPKDLFVDTMGVLLFCTSLFLIAAFSSANILTVDTATISAFALPFVFGGMFVGKKLRGHISQVQFRKVVAGCLFLIGINLIRRATIEFGFF